MRKNPIQAQDEVFHKLLLKAEDTEWGKKYDYRSINDYETYRTRVPLQSYEDVEPYIQRLRNGEQNLLWPSEIRWYAKSSGTTNSKSKFIPVSYEALEYCHFLGGKDVYAIYLTNNPDNEIFKGKSLALGGSHQICEFNSESYYGDLSAVMISNLPFWADIKRIPSQNIALLSEWEEKLSKMVEKTVNRKVTNIAGVPSWTLVLIKRILEYTGKKYLSEVWPDLELFIHGGISFAPYRSQFDALIGNDKMNYMETYNASEGFFAIQDDPARSDMLLMLDYGIFYEFITLNDLSRGNNKTVSIQDVKTGVNYAMIISTNAGLWRYIIGDTIQFTSKNPYKIKITGRIKHFINAFGEELIIDNADKAIKKAAEKTNALIREYTVAPVYIDANNRGTHEWLIEFEQKPNNIDRFIEVLDNELKSLNSDYEAKRYKNITMDVPRVIFARENLFYDWLKKHNKIGGQHKIPRLKNDRDLIEELIKMNN
ncbi:MAG: GH3 auxin-responsive promoter family protein [Marinilabiliales bacterium]